MLKSMSLMGNFSDATDKFRREVLKVLGQDWDKEHPEGNAFSEEGLLVYRAQQRERSESIRQEQNIEKVLGLAVGEVQRMETVSPKPVDEDWIARLFNIVKDVSNKDMQLLWGKILAGEIKQPGSFSLRTLETIRNLSQTDAIAFEKVVPLMVQLKGNVFMTQKTEILEKYGVAYSDILLLDECGLIKMSSNTGIITSLEEPQYILTTERLAIITATADENMARKIEYLIYPLTSAGEELYSILEKKCNHDYIVDLTNDIVKRNKSVKMKIEVFKRTHPDATDGVHYEKKSLFSTQTTE